MKILLAILLVGLQCTPVNSGRKFPVQTIGDFRIDYDHAYPRLVENGVEWMSYEPKELATHDFAIRKCEGKVLVGGLGLGYIVEKLAEKPTVTKITVIEISPEVKELVWRFLDKRGKCDIVIDDIENYLKTTKERFDYIYLDVFSDTNEYEFAKRLRILANKLVPINRVLVWENIGF